MMHAHVQAAIELSQDNDIKPVDVEEIGIYLSRNRHTEIKMPKNTTEARVNLPFCVAVAI